MRELPGWSFEADAYDEEFPIKQRVFLVAWLSFPGEREEDAGFEGKRMQRIY